MISRALPGSIIGCIAWLVVLTLYSIHLVLLLFYPTDELSVNKYSNIQMRFIAPRICDECYGFIIGIKLNKRIMQSGSKTS